MISSRQREWGIGVACLLQMVHGGIILQAQEPTPLPVRVPVIAVHRDVRYATVAGVEPRFHSLGMHAPPGAKSAPVIVCVHGGY